MKLTDKQINQYIAETTEYMNRDAFAARVVITSYDHGGRIAEIDPSYFEQAARLWDVIRLPFRDLIKEIGITQAQVSTRFGIGTRTVQGWCSRSAKSARQCAPYIRMMIAELLGYLSIRE